jgi:hypothetical protein
MRTLFFFIVCLSFFQWSCNQKKVKDKFNAGVKLNRSYNHSNAPLVINRLAQIDSVINTSIPVIRLKNLDRNFELAQILALNHPGVKSTYLDNILNKNTLSEVVNIRKALPNDLPNIQNNANIYKVDIYNFGLNLTTIVYVDIVNKEVVKLDYYRQMQPELNEKFGDLATDIAINSKEVLDALGYKPSEKDALMSSTKTALNKTKCERSLHLCVAPTFIKGNRALWAIVDLTDLRLVGVRWTKVGNSGPDERVSEKSLQVSRVMDCNCNKTSHISKDNWEMDYILTSSDGLEVTNVRFKGKPVLSSAKLVDFHVVYSNTDGFGYSDAIGCPEFSAAAVTAVSDAEVLAIDYKGVDGFVLQQIFRSDQWPKPCNYSYIQGFEFYKDGSFRVSAGSLGRGCGNDGTYRPVTRIVFANQQQQFMEYQEDKWTTWSNEKWVMQNELTSYYSQRFPYKLNFSNNDGYYIEPGIGQFKDNRGDFAYTYITKHHPELEEGDADLPTIGPCCNTNFEQGPEKFINKVPEEIVNQPLVLWYVSQIKNNGTKGQEYCWAESYLERGIYKTKVFPCVTGPRFVPIHN